MKRIIFGITSIFLASPLAHADIREDSCEEMGTVEDVTYLGCDDADSETRAKKILLCTYCIYGLPCYIRECPKPETPGPTPPNCCGYEEGCDPGPQCCGECDEEKFELDIAACYNEDDGTMSCYDASPLDVQECVQLFEADGTYYMSC